MLKVILVNFGVILCDILNVAIFVQILVSWTIGTHNRGYEVLDTLTGPILRLVRKIIPATGMLDFSPMLAMFALELAKGLWTALIMAL